MSCLLQTAEVFFWIRALKRLGQCEVSFLAAEAVCEPWMVASGSGWAGRIRSGGSGTIHGSGQRPVAQHAA